VNASGKRINMETIVMLSVTALMLVYLFYALLRPEKF
jgi:K+-transporting ATPase KdpF subunit